MHVPGEVAVEIALDGTNARFCSVRCAEAASARAARKPAFPALPSLPKRILVAVDGSGPSLRATELAAAFAKASDGRITLLHAIDPRWLRWLPGASALIDARLAVSSEEIERSLRKDADAQLSRCRHVCEEAGVPVTEKVLVETPLRALSEAAAQADLIVIGSRGLGAVSGAALGSLSHRVIGETRKPVLVVH
jgi:nucleotide-binding universal stress UspA family protein